MAADIPLVASNTAAAPKDYLVPGVQEIILRQLTAEIDGSSAATAFLPVVELLAPGGIVMGRWFDRNVSIAAGASATVTWFPGVAPTTSSSTSGWPWAYISQTGHTTCGAGATTELSATLGNFYTSDSSVFDAAANGAGNNGIRLLADGHYLVVVTVQPFGTPTAGRQWEIAAAGGGSVANYEQGPTNILFPTGGNTDLGRTVEGTIMSVGDSTPAPTTPITAQVTVTAAGSVVLALAGIRVFQLDTNVGDLT